MKYSALIVLLALAVCWSSAEARYNKYQQDVINSMTDWSIEELRDLPEPQKTNLTSRLNEAKERKWENLGEYFKHEKQIMLEFLLEQLRSKRSVQYHSQSENLAEQIQRISNIF